MRIIILFLIIPLSVFSEIFPPKIQVLELPPKLMQEVGKPVTDWAKSELIGNYTIAEIIDPFLLMKSMAIYRFTATEDSFANLFFKISNNEKIIPVVAKLADAEVILNKFKDSDDIDRKRLAWYYFDYLTDRFPKDKKYEKIRDSLPQGNWMTLIPGYSYRFSGYNDIARSEPEPITDKIVVPAAYRSRARAMTKNKTSVNGLIVITLRNGRKKGMAAEITAHSVKGAKQNGYAYIDQDVGFDMKRSVVNAMMAVQNRYPIVESHKDVMFSFDERESMKDGNSAGVAFTLLLYSLYEGIELDPEVAVTGVILPDCGVKAVGGVPSKIRGAWQKGLKIAIIPEENIETVSDLTLMYELSILWNIQIFTASKFTEVLPIAKVKKAEKVKQSIAKFNKLIPILNKGGNEIIKNKKMILAELDQILKLTPNHESARVLKLMLSGQRPKSLSMNGSIDYLFMMIDRILGISPEKAYETSEEIIVKNKSSVSASFRKISPETRAFAAEIIKYADSLIKYRRLMVLNLHNDKKKIGTALNLMDEETENMDQTRERLQQKWERIQNSL